MEDKNKEVQLKEEEAEKVSGGKPCFVYIAEQDKISTVPWIFYSPEDDDIGGGD